MKNFKYIFLILAIPVLLFFMACQDIFTYSPFSGAQRDPSTMTDAQKINYANDALSSGDDEAIEKALKTRDETITQVEQTYRKAIEQAEQAFKESEQSAKNASDESVRQALRTYEGALAQAWKKRGGTVEQAWKVYTKETG